MGYIEGKNKWHGVNYKIGTITELFLLLKDTIMKLTLNDLKALFTIAKVSGAVKVSKHQASKKGYGKTEETIRKAKSAKRNHK